MRTSIFALFAATACLLSAQVKIATEDVAVTVDGKPFKITLPVAKAQVGCVIVPTIGVVGVTGWVLITALPDATEVHPEEPSVTVKV